MITKKFFPWFLNHFSATERSESPAIPSKSPQRDPGHPAIREHWSEGKTRVISDIISAFRRRRSRCSPTDIPEVSGGIGEDQVTVVRVTVDVWSAEEGQCEVEGEGRGRRRRGAYEQSEADWDGEEWGGAAEEDDGISGYHW